MQRAHKDIRAAAGEAAHQAVPSLSSHGPEPATRGKHQPGPGPPPQPPQPTAQGPLSSQGPAAARRGAAGMLRSPYLLGLSLMAGGLPGGGGAVKSSSMSFRVTFFLHSHSASWRVILFSKPTRSNMERSVS